MVLLNSHPDKQGRKQRENVSLQKCHQQLDAIHKHHKNY